MNDPDRKAEIRAALKQRLRAMTLGDRQQQSAAAVSRLLAAPQYASARSVMLYISMASEVDTARIFQDAFAAGKTVAVPRAHLADHSMEAIVIGDLTRDMRKTAIGVLEPIGGEILAAGRIDLVVVPGLGFGPAGERIGRGAGFYDRFLGNPALRAVKCGLAFEEQLFEGIPMSATDTWIDMLITSRATRQFRQKSS